jgi:8-oxo-dGTP diphosphatase
VTTGTRFIVVGVDAGGREVVRVGLAHGDDPITLLAAHGWKVQWVREVARHPVDKLMLMTFVVEQHALTQPITALGLNRSDDDLAIFEGEVAPQHQRMAAYAVVTSSRGVLVTQFSAQAGTPGLWGLPGGGLESEEAPEDAVVREVWEESGQVIQLGDLVLVRTSRWVGRAPTGRLEDFHAVRVIYRAICPEPTEPTVHDIGGTTASAAWMLPASLERLALTPGWRSILREVSAGLSSCCHRAGRDR